MKKLLIPVLVIVGLIVVAWILIFLARGADIELAVTDPSKGAEDAPILIEEFSDFQCPACAAAAPIVAEVLKAYPNQVRFVYKDFPLSQIHPFASEAAVGALCAAQQGKFQEFHDALFEGQAEWAPRNGDGNVSAFLNELALQHVDDHEAWQACTDSRSASQAVNADFREGSDRGVSSTPSFFVNGKRVQNPNSVFAWIQIIDAELEEMGITPENRMTDEAEEPAEEEAAE